MTKPNTSTAVMARRVEARDSLDYFPTPPWATRALCEWLIRQGHDLHGVCWEPACGEMFMVRALAEYFNEVIASDVADYPPLAALGRNAWRVSGPSVADFLLTGRVEAPVDWIITNPPFNLAAEFVETALTKARSGVAMLVRTAFLESEGRGLGLFTHSPPSDVIVFMERVVMLKGRLVRAGSFDPFALEPGKKASSATSFSWLVWRKVTAESAGVTRLHWFPPCRRELERDGDYPDYGMAAGDAADLPMFEENQFEAPAGETIRVGQDALKGGGLARADACDAVAVDSRCGESLPPTLFAAAG